MFFGFLDDVACTPFFTKENIYFAKLSVSATNVFARLGLKKLVIQTFGVRFGEGKSWVD